MKKQFIVIARLAPKTTADGHNGYEAVLVSPKNGRFFSSLEEAKAAAEDHKDLADMIVGQVDADLDCLGYRDGLVLFRGLSPTGYFGFNKNKGYLGEAGKSDYDMLKTMALVSIARKKAGLA